MPRSIRPTRLVPFFALALALAAIFAGRPAAELCDGYDNDCSGQIDDEPGCATDCPQPDTCGDPVEGSLGTTSSGLGRVNDAPCP